MDLSIRVAFSAIDKLTRPVSAASKAIGGLSDSLKQTQGSIKEVERQSAAFNRLRDSVKKTSRTIDDTTRTLELRIAQSVDRMSPFARGGLLAFTIAAMLLLATTVLMAGVRSALSTMEELRQAGAAAAPVPAPAAAGERRDPYEAYRVDDVLEVDDDGRHVPPR